MLQPTYVPSNSIDQITTSLVTDTPFPELLQQVYLIMLWINYSHWSIQKWLSCMILLCNVLRVASRNRVINFDNVSKMLHIFIDPSKSDSRNHKLAKSEVIYIYIYISIHLPTYTGRMNGTSTNMFLTGLDFPCKTDGNVLLSKIC